MPTDTPLTAAPDRLLLDLNPSKALESISVHQPPPILYHYTSRAALLSILSHRVVYASSIRHLNDSREYAQASSIATEYIDSELQTSSDADDKALLSEISLHLSSMQDHVTICVFSLTEHGDQLSQWRSYCAPMDGYAIGFDTSALLTAAGTDFLLVRCEYRGPAQRRIINQLLHDTRSTFKSRRASGSSLSRACISSAAYFTLVFRLVAPVLKHPAFEAEAEWRLVSRSFAPLRFRSGRSMLIPYCDVTLAAPTDALPIVELVVGPTPHSELEFASARQLLASVHSTSSVRLSQVPFRPW